MKTTASNPRRRPQRPADLREEPATTDDVVELLLLALLGLPLMVGFAKAAVHLSAWLLNQGVPLAALVGICIVAALLGALLFGLLAALSRRCAQTWSRKKRRAA
jgi:formate hydrogenlyase subunit 3/multisubunit Na+/H+ antiporter MnhD subunit